MPEVVPQASYTWKSLVCGNPVFGYFFFFLFDSGNLITDEFRKIIKYLNRAVCIYSIPLWNLGLV